MARRLLFLVNADWYFCSHRLPMARAARAGGFEVHVATHVQDHADAIRAEGFVLHPLGLRRGSTDPRNLVRTIREVRALYRRLMPVMVHHVGVQPSVTGSLAAQGLPIKSLNAITGLGFAFTSATPRARVVRAILSPAMAVLFNRPGAAVLVQNPDDRAAMRALGVRDASIATIPGSGVDTRHFAPLEEPSGVLTVGYVGRLLKDKGLDALVRAHALLAERGSTTRLAMAGDLDPHNPASFQAEEIERWKRIPGVDVLGRVRDVRDVWRSCHVAVLPSRREGLPLSLLEAAACGRPIIATDVPGCREVARRDENALLVPVDDPPAMAMAIERMAGDPAMRARFGSASRALAEQRFSTDRIGAAVVALYEGLLRGMDAKSLSV